MGNIFLNSEIIKCNNIMKDSILYMLFFFFLLAPKESVASHAAGMDISYECITAGTPATPTTSVIGYGNISVNIQTGAWASECYWTVTNSSGIIVAQGGQGGAYSNNSTYFTIYCLSQGSYSFNWYDTYGDGWNGGSYTISDNSGNTIISGNPSSGSSGVISFSISSPCGNMYQTTWSGGTPDTYKITLRFYRDCSGISAPGSFPLTYSSNLCGINSSINLSLISTTNITPVCATITDPCNTPGVVGIEEYIYEGTITISKCPDWVLAACESARNGAITTGPTGDLCIQAELNNTQFCNNSPIFTEYPTPYLCVNQQFCYNNGALDPDGDSLVYSLVTPLNGANGSTVTYNPPYSAINPILGTTTFNPLTGDLCMLANQVEVSVVAMKVSEYRNGVFIGSVIRDIQIIVLNNCSTTPPVLTGINGAPVDVTIATVADVNIDHCTNGIDPIIFTINASIGASSDKEMSWSGLSGSQINPATFIVSANNSINPNGTFTWTPDYLDVSNSPFYFTVTVVDDACPINNSFSFTYTINLTSSSGFSVQESITNVSCPNLFDGAIDIIISGISGVPTFSWTGPNGFSAITEDILALEIGQYNLQITAPDGCVTDYIYDVLSNSVSLSSLDINTKCVGAFDGSIDLTVVGGLSPYLYSWVGPNGFTSNIEDLANIEAGTYTVTVSDALLCSENLTVTLVDPTPLAVSGSVTSDYNGSDISCFGDADGEITASISGGFSPYSYSIDGVSFSSVLVFPSLSAGSYTLYYKDDNACQLSELITISAPASLTLTLLNISDITCFGDADGAIDINISGGTQNNTAPFYTYSWTSPSNGFIANTEDVNNLSQAGTYYCSILDANNCPVNSLPYTITEPSEITVVESQLDVKCFGESNGNISLVVNGGNPPYSIIWNGPNSYANIQVSSPYNLTQLVAGDYNYTITDANGCQFVPPNPITLVQPAEIMLTLTASAVSCFGGDDGSIDLTVSNVTNPSFVWTSTSSLIFNETTQDIFSLSQGVYTVVVTDALTSCTQTDFGTIQTLTTYNVFTSVNNESCFGMNDGSINITPNSSAVYTYNWVYPDASVSTSQNVSNAVPGNYQLIISYTAQISSGLSVVCDIPYSFTVNPATELIVNPSISLVSCEGGTNGSIGLSVNGGISPYTYLWSNIATTKDINNLSTGTYSVSILDKNNCSPIIPISIVLGSMPFDTLSVSIIDVDCNSASTGSIDINGINGGVYPYSFSWSGPNGFVSLNEDIINLSVGAYLVEISDASGCVISRYISVKEPMSPLYSLVTDIDSVSCKGYSDGSIEITTSGGTSPYLFDWGSANPDSLTVGIHTCVISDANGCKLTISGDVLEPDSIIITSSITEISCPNENTGAISILLAGDANSSSTVSWIGPVSFNQPFTAQGTYIDNLFTGNYYCLVTNSKGCTAQRNIYVSEPYTDAGSPVFTTSNYSTYEVSCKGGSDGWIKIEIIGGDYSPNTYQYYWSNGTNTDSLFGLAADTLQLLIVDSINCTDTFDYIIREPDSIVSFTYILSDTNGYNISCYGNADAYSQINAVGGVYDYNYTLFHNDTIIYVGKSDYLSVLKAGNYYLIVKDKNNCTASDTFTLSQPDSLSLELVLSPDTCELNKGMAEALISGGVQGYAYYWSSGDILQSVDTLSEGRYELVVIDKNYCEISRPFDIENLPSPIANFSLNPSHKKFEDQFNNPFVFIDISETFSQKVINWNWELSDYTILYDSIIFHSFEEIGEYTVLLMIETEYNCIDTISKKVFVDNYTLFIPNAFSPNSNEVENTVFKPQGIGVKEFAMKIYSRWGEEIFYSENINYGWNGLVNKEKATIGTYTYYIKVLNLYNEVYEYEGVLKLIR